MKIITVPHPKLKQVSHPVTQFDTKLVKFIHQLESTLYNKKNPEGVGLSAPQVASNIRLFCTYLGQNQRFIKTYINPEITAHPPDLTLGPNPDKPILEGCLSIPYIYAPVYRHPWIELAYQTVHPQTLKVTSHTQTFHAFPARVIQHEFDHLNGILFTQRALQNQLPLYQEKDNQLIKLELINPDLT